MRGRVMLDDEQVGESRSIPAHAGQSFPSGPVKGLNQVHPRACGAELRRSSLCDRAAGPSPRMRGRVMVGARETKSPRSIPAHAGQSLDTNATWCMISGSPVHQAPPTKHWS